MGKKVLRCLMMRKLHVFHNYLFLKLLFWEFLLKPQKHLFCIVTIAHITQNNFIKAFFVIYCSKLVCTHKLNLHIYLKVLQFIIKFPLYIVNSSYENYNNDSINYGHTETKLHFYINLVFAYK